MRRLLLVLLLSSLAYGTNYNVTAVRILGAPAGTITGTVTTVGTAVTDVTGAFTTGSAWNNIGIIINSVVYTVASVSSSSALTLTTSAGTQASPVAYTIMTSACYATPNCNGWVAEVDIATIGTGGTYSLGFSQSSNNVPTSAKIVFTVTSNGFTNSAGATTYVRTVYATHVLREPQPNSGTNDEVSSGGTFTTRLALSGPIFSSDTATVVVSASFYTHSTDTNNSFSGTPTNNSTAAYPSPVFNWTYPGWQRIGGSSFTVRGTGFSQLPMNGLPLACVVFTATDAHSHSVSTTVTVPTIDPTLGDKAPIVEYIGTLSTSTLTQADKITVKFQAYPWIGSAALDSNDGTNSNPTPLYTNQTYLLDKSNVYSAAAYVDGSETFPGSHTSGTFQAGEKVTQSTSSAVAYLIDVTGANGAGPIHIGQVVSGTTNSTNGSTWTGATSGAVFTQTGAPTAAGADSNACAIAESSWNPGSPPPACATISGAATKMAAYNNASSTPTHNDVCGTMYLNAGYYNWAGSSSTIPSTTSNCWATITPTSGLTQSQVVIDQQSGNKNFSANNVCTSGTTTCGTPVHLKNLKILIATSPVSDFDQITYLWLDGISFTDNGGTAPIYRDTIVYATDSAFPSTLGGNGLGNFGSQNMAMAIIRGNDVTTAVSASGVGAAAYVTIGNYNNASGNCVVTDNQTGAPLGTMPIVAFNLFYKCNNVGNSLLVLLKATSSPVGAAVVQNIFENIGINEAAPVLAITADNSTGTPTNNVMIWNNIIVGGRINRGYADLGSTTLTRSLWSEIGNIFDGTAIKSDTFSGNSLSGARSSNWVDLYMSGAYSNLYPDLTGGTTGWPPSGSFCNEFGGIYSYQTALSGGQPPACGTNSTINYPKYNNRLAYDGTAGNGGGGDYNLLSNSPAINMIPPGFQTIPYDLAGQLRNNSGWGSAGVYEQSKVLASVFSF